METLEKVNRVSLDLISVSETNKIVRGAAKLNQATLKELSESIAQMDVLQPISLRPDPNENGKYIIIFGERRFWASKLAGKSDIPAYIHHVDETRAFDIQITENLQRECKLPRKLGQLKVSFSVYKQK